MPTTAVVHTPTPVVYAPARTLLTISPTESGPTFAIRHPPLDITSPASEIENDPPPRKTRKRKPRSQDLSPETAALVSDACSDYKAYLCAAMPYPDPDDMVSYAQDSWSRANSRRDPDQPCLPFTKEIQTLVSVIGYTIL